MWEGYGLMGNSSITQELRREKEINSQDSNWEKESYQIGCGVSRHEALQRLKGIDDKLFQDHPPSWEVRGFKERTLVTCFGEIRISRRLYRDEKGSYHFLLDEYLGLPAGQAATPGLQESLVDLAAQVPFRQVSGSLEKLTEGVLSATTIHRLLQKASDRAMEKEREDCQALFERGELPLGQERKVSLLFSEYDGIWIHLQREEGRNYEIKNAIAYEGWKRLPGKEERYSLVNKRVYCHASDEIPFWEGASLEWSRVWDLSYLKEMVIGGDGANWIDVGIEEFAGSIRQLDGFHLARASGQGWQEGGAIYQAIRAGETQVARSLMNHSAPKEGERAQKARRYVERNLYKGRDWRTQSEIEGRGLGTMESNEDKLVANRMKKRGLSWKIRGAQRMAKVIQLRANGEIRRWCERQRISPPPAEVLQSTSKSRSNGYQEWLQASLPALSGPHASRPWVEKLRSMTYNSFPLN